MTQSELLRAVIDVGSKATGVPFVLGADESTILFNLAFEYGAPRILAAWKLYQSDKGKKGKPVRFFAADIGEFLWRIDDAGQAPKAFFKSDTGDAEHESMMAETSARCIRESEERGFTVSPTGIRTFTGGHRIA